MKSAAEETSSTGDGVSATDRLVFVWEGGTSSIALADDRTVSVGRSGAMDVVLGHSSISREHAQFALQRGRLTVVDASSKHGVRVGGRAISPNRATEVPSGAMVELGEVLVFRSSRCQQTAEAQQRAAWNDVDRLLPLVARGTISILVLGETGAGKEVMAHAIHRRSPRSRGPFVTIHCAALPESLLEAELFGYEKGAFTGASVRKAGLLELASGGTAFLDEITEIPLSIQAKLLRAVETRSVTRLGAVRPTPTDVRFVAATNRDIDALVANGSFRDDLYYRVAGFTLTVPALRTRLGEIDALATRFATEAARALDRRTVSIDDAVYDRLRSYPWPGNVRELRNVMESAVLLAAGERIELQHLPARLLEPRVGPASHVGRRSLPEEIEQLERTRILDALERAGGNQSRAARDLGISRRLLLERLDLYGTPRPRKSGSMGRASLRK